MVIDQSGDPTHRRGVAIFTLYLRTARRVIPYSFSLSSLYTKNSRELLSFPSWHDMRKRDINCKSSRVNAPILTLDESRGCICILATRLDITITRASRREASRAEALARSISFHCSLFDSLSFFFFFFYFSTQHREERRVHGFKETDLSPCTLRGGIFAMFAQCALSPREDESCPKLCMYINISQRKDRTLELSIKRRRTRRSTADAYVMSISFDFAPRAPLYTPTYIIYILYTSHGHVFSVFCKKWRLPLLLLSVYISREKIVSCG